MTLTVILILQHSECRWLILDIFAVSFLMDFGGRKGFCKRSILHNAASLKENLMKAVILAGGLGTRISEESHLRPKPMIEIGGRPILWHVMNIYTSYGVTDFIICLGYRG